MQGVGEDDEQVGIYKGDSGMDEEEFNDLEGARQNAMFEKKIELQEQMVMDDGRNMLDGYTRDYSHPPCG